MKMKKLAVIAVVFGALALGSCTKEDIRPNTTDENAPVWKSTRAGEGTGSSGTSTVGDGGVVGSTGITDPNNDEDGNGRKKN